MGISADQNLQPTIVYGSDVWRENGYTMSEVHGEIREEIEKMNLPQGYSFFWDSQYKDQTEGLQALVKFFPLAFLMLVVIFGRFILQFPSTDNHPLRAPSLLNRGSDRYVTYRVRFRLFPDRRMVGTLGYDYQKRNRIIRRD